MFLPSRTFLAVAVVLMAGAAAAQQSPANLVARCDGKFALCGYIDKTTREQVIAPLFERAMPFSEGLAAVRIRGRFGYIDLHGNVMISPAFDLAGPFREGHAEILIGDKAGIIDRSGKIVIQPQFARALPWTNDIILASQGTWRSGHYHEMEQLEPLPRALYRGTFGLYHIDGYWIRRPDLSGASPFAPDGAPPIWAKDSSGLFGLLKPDGTWLIAPQYDYGSMLHQGRAVVRKRVNGEDLSGIVGANGEVIVALQPRALHLPYRQQGWTITRESAGKREGFLDESGQLVGGRYFDEVRAPTEANGNIASVRIDGLWKGLDRAGNIVPHPDNGRIRASCPDGMVAVSIDGKVQITDAGGRPMLPYLIEPLVSKPDCTKPFPIERGGKWGYVTPEGRALFNPPAFDSVYPFEGGYAVVVQNRKFGIIDTSGRFTQPPKFDQLKGRLDGLFQFVLDGQELWITATGEQRGPPKPLYIRRPQVLDCGHGMRLFERDGRWGIAESDGREVVAPRHRALSCFRNGVAWAALDARREWCPIGPDGAVRSVPRCQTAYYPDFPSHHYPERLSDDPFESSVLWSRAHYEFHSGQRDIPPGWVGDGVRGGPSNVVVRW